MTAGALTAARRLLLLEKSKRESASALARLFPFVVGFGNLMLCGYYERSIEHDINGHALGLLLSGQFAMYLLLICAHLLGGASKILAKTRIFPLPPMSRVLYFAGSNIIGPVPAALLLSNLFFLAVHLRHSALAAVMGPVLFLTAALTVDVAISVFLLAVSRTKNPSAATSIFLLAVFVVGGAALTFVNADILGSALPPIWIIVVGILTARAGTVGTSLAGIGVFLVIMFAALAIGRKAA